MFSSRNCCLSVEGDGAQQFPAWLPFAPLLHGRPAGIHQGKQNFHPAREKLLQSSSNFLLRGHKIQLSSWESGYLIPVSRVIIIIV